MTVHEIHYNRTSAWLCLPWVISDLTSLSHCVNAEWRCASLGTCAGQLGLGRGSSDPVYWEFKTEMLANVSLGCDPSMMTDMPQERK